MLIQRCNSCEQDKSNESTVLWYEINGQCTGANNTRHAFNAHACSMKCLLHFIGTLPQDTLIEAKILRS